MKKAKRVENEIRQVHDAAENATLHVDPAAEWKSIATELIEQAASRKVTVRQKITSQKTSVKAVRKSNRVRDELQRLVLRLAALEEQIKSIKKVITTLAEDA